MPIINVGILTVSDRCSRGDAKDESGPALKSSLADYSSDFLVQIEDCVPDDVQRIEDKLMEWCRVDSSLRVVLTTGGTGFSARDVTPEATNRIIDKHCPAITTAMTVASLKITPLAMLSRSVSGIKNATLIINLPGSKKGAVECLQVVLPCLKHAAELLSENKTLVEQTHAKLKETSNVPCSKVTSRKVIDRNRISPWPMVSMNEAVSRVMESVSVMDKLTIPLSDALGFVLCDDVMATDCLPPFRASVKDGYALRSSNGIGDYRVVSALTAGCSPDSVLELKDNECVRVNTGGPVPHSADAVVQVENTVIVESDADGNEVVVRILTESMIGQDIRPIGSDIDKGLIILRKSAEIKSIEHGLLAAVGTEMVPVFRKPIVSVLSTGNELVPAGGKLAPGKVRDSNMITLHSLLSENGFQALNMGIAEDTPDILLRELSRSLTLSDVLITTGSVSMGEKDFVQDVLARDFEADLKFGRVNMKPGKPTTFAVLRFREKTKYVFALPGNPASAVVMMHLLVLPALRKMSGCHVTQPPTLSVIVDFDIKLDDRPEYRRALLDFSHDDGCPRAINTGSQVSSRLLSFKDANCLLVLPSKKETANGFIHKGDRVKAILVNRI